MKITTNVHHVHTVGITHHTVALNSGGHYTEITIMTDDGDHDLTLFHDESNLPFTHIHQD